MKEYRIKKDTLDAIADEIQRLAKLEDPLSPEEMRAALSQLVITEQEELWAYLNQTTLYLNRGDSFVQNGTILEVRYG